MEWLLYSALMRRADSLDTIERCIGRISRVGNSVSAYRERGRRSGYPMSGPAVGILGALARQGPGRVSLIARRVGLAGTLVSREVGALHRDGLVHRSPDVDDQRAVIVTITDRGRDAYQSHRAAAIELTGELLHSWTAVDLASLAALLQRMAEDFSGGSAGRRPTDPTAHQS